MFGDPNQCKSVETTKVYYDYLKSIPISEMCPKRVKMKYKPECARYDTPTKEFLDKIEETMLQPQPKYTNICYLNKTRRRITEDCCNRFSADKESMLVGFQYQGRLEKYMIAAEMPLLVTKNMRQHNLFNNQACKINTFDENEVVVEDEEHNMITMKLSEFRDSFIAAFNLQLLSTNTRVVLSIDLTIFTTLTRWTENKCIRHYHELLNLSTSGLINQQGITVNQKSIHQ